MKAGEAGAAERIVLIEDRDLGDLQVLGEVLHPGFGLGVIARAHVDDVVELGIAQEARAGERADERHLGGGGDRLRGRRGRRADRADSANTLSLLDQLLGRRDRAIRLVAVVHAGQLDLAAMHAALGVDFVECRIQAHLHAEAERRGRAFQHGRLAEHDGVRPSRRPRRWAVSAQSPRPTRKPRQACRAA